MVSLSPLACQEECIRGRSEPHRACARITNYLVTQGKSLMTIENWHEQLRRGTLELAVLLAVTRTPRYGLEILRHLAVTHLNLPEGTIYPLLTRLEHEGLLSAEWVSGQGP